MIDFIKREKEIVIKCASNELRDLVYEAVKKTIDQANRKVK